MPPSLQIGPYTVIALADGAGPFFSHRSKAFPDATTEQWAAADRLDPGALDTDGRWWLQFRAFAIRSDQGVTLVDAGIGPVDSPAASWAPVPGALPASLAAAGIEPSHVDTVVLTHLHTDHVGWAVVGGEQARPFFPNAAYALQQAELDAIEEINPQLRATVIDPLRRTGQLRLLDGDTPCAAASAWSPRPVTRPATRACWSRPGANWSPSPVICSCTRSSCSTPKSPMSTKWTRNRRGPPGDRCSTARTPTPSTSRPHT